MQALACESLAGFRNVFLFRCGPSILHRPTTHGFRLFRPHSTSEGIDNSESIESTTRRSIKEKFVAAAHSIEYHIPERSPDPTEAQLNSLQDNLRYIFKEKALLRLALIHRSAAAPNSSSLAWIGDAALQMVITEQLAAAEGCASPGRLSDFRKLLASREHCASCAKTLGLQHVIVTGKSLSTDLQNRDAPLSINVLGEAFEAVLGAIFVDGGITAVRHSYGVNFPLTTELQRMGG